jgi:hypothetical protein
MLMKGRPINFAPLHLRLPEDRSSQEENGLATALHLYGETGLVYTTDVKIESGVKIQVSTIGVKLF